jgi:hypothetical protein
MMSFTAQADEDEFVVTSGDFNVVRQPGKIGRLEVDFTQATVGNLSTMEITDQTFMDYLKENDTITKMELMRILNENAPKDESNRFQQLTITKKKLQEYFPTFYTKSQMEKVLFDLLAEWKKKQDEEG